MGRVQSVAALARLLRKGASVMVLGGAKIGKTSLVRQVALELGEDSPTLFVDDADSLAAPEGPATICLTTSTPWRLPPELAVKLKPFPMAVWDRRLTGALIARFAPDAPTATVSRIVSLAGGHPFLLKGLLSQGADIDAALEACRPRFEAAFAAWLEEMSPDARSLVDLLVERAGYVAFDDARRRLDRPHLKLEADRLCWLGVIERRLRGDMAVATLRAGCGLFNDWYRARR